MNREILFRGKTIYEPDWVEGYFAKDENNTYIFYPSTEVYKTKDVVLQRINVIPETVGQYTGLNYQNEKDGRKMFEGDVFRRYNDLFVIKVGDFHGYRFVVELADGSGHGADTLTKADAEYGEYVGNIHDNPELISKKHE